MFEYVLFFSYDCNLPMQCRNISTLALAQKVKRYNAPSHDSEDDSLHFFKFNLVKINK